jgi:hypothetical protein
MSVLLFCRKDDVTILMIGITCEGNEANQYLGSSLNVGCFFATATVLEF